MPPERARKRPPRSRLGLPRISGLIDVSDEMIAFVETYQQVWANEARAMHALGDFLAARADSLRTQVELMRMGSDAARRYGSWADALMGFRPESFLESWMQAMRGQPSGDESEAGDGD
ncbi:MAG TPA: hypothetical protein VFY79_03515 [Dehalococcoidia bacterium]|jgi:hypothetical protein|nr:hypothetical protein [Dehalococcoidia bacterium]